MSSLDHSTRTKRPKNRRKTANNLPNVHYGYNCSLSEASWSEINQIGQSGLASSLFSIGDAKNIQLNTGETLTMEIIGFDHDDLADGSGKAPYTFATKHLMADTHIINAATSDYDDFYRGTDMYDFLETTVYSILPSELKSFIKAASKLFTTNSYGSSENMHASAKLWLLSTAEIGYEEYNYRPVGEGVRYARFTGDSSRIKKIANGTGAASKWWTRTPYAMNMWADYWRVNEDGADIIQAHGSVTDSLGVCFGFCV